VKTIYGIDGFKDANAATSVWVCPECFDVYEARTPSGDCPNPGHAPVRLFAAAVRSLVSRDVATGGEEPALATIPRAARGDRKPKAA
jgi:hypothetical protein